jgi:copper chaperone
MDIGWLAFEVEVFDRLGHDLSCVVIMYVFRRRDSPQLGPRRGKSRFGVLMSDTDQQTYNVTGMTCEHCVAAVSATVGELSGVSRVDVELASGRVVVHGGSVDGEAVRHAIEAAGYSLA